MREPSQSASSVGREQRSQEGVVDARSGRNSAHACTGPLKANGVRSATDCERSFCLAQPKDVVLLLTWRCVKA